MRIGRRLMKALVWGLLLCLSILGGGLWFAYWYMTDGETVAQLIREHAVRYFPHSTLDPGRVRISLYGGELVFRQLRMIQKIEGAPFEVLRIPWLNIKINSRKLAKGHLEAREVVVGTPTLRLRRRHDGTWNLDGLLADPWPGPWIDTPPITIQNATLELFPDDEPLAVGAAQDFSKPSLMSGERTSAVSGKGPEPGLSSSPSLPSAPTGGVANRSPGDPPRRLPQNQRGRRRP